MVAVQLLLCYAHTELTLGADASVEACVQRARQEKERFEGGASGSGSIMIAQGWESGDPTPSVLVVQQPHGDNSYDHLSKLGDRCEQLQETVHAQQRQIEALQQRQAHKQADVPDRSSLEQQSRLINSLVADRERLETLVGSLRSSLEEMNDHHASAHTAASLAYEQDTLTSKQRHSEDNGAAQGVVPLFRSRTTVPIGAVQLLAISVAHQVTIEC